MWKTTKKIISLVVGIFFILSFFAFYGSNRFAAICILISGILLLPQANEYIKKTIIKKYSKSNEELSNEEIAEKVLNSNGNSILKKYNTARKIIIVVLAFIFFANISETDNIPNTRNTPNISNWQNTSSTSNINNNSKTESNTSTQEISQNQPLPVDAREIEQNTIDQELIDESVEKTITEKNGTYTGQRINGKKQGTGKYVWNNGAIYEGEFSDNNINGKGKLTIPDKGTYEGNFINGKKDGQGTITFSNGDIYTGEWKEDKMSGQGQYTFANGDTYEGSFLENKFNGQGTYTKGENKYTGTWENNQYKNN